MKPPIFRRFKYLAPVSVLPSSLLLQRYQYDSRLLLQAPHRPISLILQVNCLTTRFSDLTTSHEQL
jgi:hypothetical protein